MTDTARAKEDAPAPDASRKPDSPTDIKKPSWSYIAKKSLREFGNDQCTDLAASLTYYSVLSLFPALLALLSILGVVGQAQQTTEAVLKIVGRFAPATALDTIRGPIMDLTHSSAAGFTLVIGILGALWSASGYVGAFGRAMNRIYEVDEGRPAWKLRPVQLLVTVAAVLLAAAAALMLVVSGPIADAIGGAVGLGPQVVAIWNIGKWPVLAAVAVVTIAILYYATPNVRQPKFRWMSLGALIALITLVVASVAFGFYVGNFGNYNKFYGTIGGVVVLLLWLWIANLALLYGAEFDAETERGRQLQAGIAAEETLQLPPRGTKVSDKKAAQRAKDVREGKLLRESFEIRRDPYANVRSRRSRTGSEEQENR
ncbi:YihY/virulence factor BrkB family protein [Paenarthrobacter sp. DKR-5]|uniref:YihY/virulence factor BrkB family protein n=1 Tax=Paenarthrobacter sp. DKR-5 TaxID=2835535 RepID=UPI001BDCD1F6|nr:YihY/virulence factor BrkB family protein [Paenarthrobacter sp. DKR-5]MBT1001150.1 YihY/virulence factor BrkB family protein [Paenarthrobacter sp. DKR-5]